VPDPIDNPFIGAGPLGLQSADAFVDPFTGDFKIDVTQREVSAPRGGVVVNHGRRNLVRWGLAGCRRGIDKLCARRGTRVARILQVDRSCRSHATCPQNREALSCNVFLRSWPLPDMQRRGLGTKRPIWSGYVPRTDETELTLQELADRLGAHRQTVYGWLRRGKLKGRLPRVGTQRIWLVKPTDTSIRTSNRESP
jgi:excisionase family DNA binding protein